MKAKEDTGEVSNGSGDIVNEAESDTSSSDIQEMEEITEEPDIQLDNFVYGLGDFPLGTETSECKFTPKPKEISVVFSSVTVPPLITAETSAAEDCRLEISVEMKAERELRRLAFTSRQRFLTGMDVISGVGSAGGAHRDPLAVSDTVEPMSENWSTGCHFFSKCIEKLIIDSFNGLYCADSVLELCLSLSDESTNPPLLLVTQKAMEASLWGLSTVEGASSRFWNIVISWFRKLLHHSRYASSFKYEGSESSSYVTVATLVENPRFSLVIGNMLTTCNLGDSGQKILGPSAVESFSLFLKEIEDTNEGGISTSTLQELLLDTLLYITTHW